MATKIPKEIEDKICQLYNDGIGTLEIAKKLNIHRTTVQKSLLRNNVKLRKTSPYKNKYNVHYFDEYTEENCYWAGFILADGCIRSDRDALEIHLQEDDKNHLIKFAKAINFTGSLVRDKSSNAYTISVAGKWFPQNLKSNFSITQRKSLTARFPKQVPNKYWKDLIRGYFDGDGCISYVIQSNDRKIPTISFVGTKHVLNVFRKHFYQLGIVLKSKNKCAPLIVGESKKCFYIAYSGVNAMKILKYLFSDSDENIRLERKYNRYEEFIGEYYE
jgi:hypothetical protein